jgi:hypothetical protein
MIYGGEVVQHHALAFIEDYTAFDAPGQKKENARPIDQSIERSTIY